MATTTIEKPASDKQKALILKLAGEREIPGLIVDAEFVAALKTTRQASKLIDALFSAPRKPQAQAQAKEGFYIGADETVYKVQRTQDGQRTYAKRLVVDVATKTGRWVYAPGVGATLAGLEPLSVAVAAKLGKRYGVCMCCGRTLTNPASIEAGIGPICASKL